MYNSTGVAEDSTLNVDQDDNSEGPPSRGRRRTFQRESNFKRLLDSPSLGRVYDSLVQDCKRWKGWSFDLDSISYRNDKSQFLASLTMLEQFVSTIGGAGDEDDREAENEVLWRLCSYLLHLLCEADHLSITKNYSNKIIATLRVIPGSTGLISRFLLEMSDPGPSGSANLSNGGLEHLETDLSTRFANIHTVLTSSIFEWIGADTFKELLTRVISLYLKLVKQDAGTSRLNGDSSELNGTQVGNFKTPKWSLEGIKCVNILLYNSLLKEYEVDSRLVARLMDHLTHILSEESTNYQLVSSCTTCYVGLLVFQAQRKEGVEVLMGVTSSLDPAGARSELEPLVTLLRNLPRMNYIYLVRSVIILLHSSSFGGRADFGQISQLLKNCYAVLSANLRRNNSFIINYALLQTAQAYTIFLSHTSTEDHGELIAYPPGGSFEKHRNGLREPRVSPVWGAFYEESLLELSGTLIRFFTEKIKTLSHLSIYIYKRLVHSLATRYSSLDDTLAPSDGYGHQSRKDTGDRERDLVSGLMESVKTCNSNKAKYVILDTLIKLISVERLLEHEPYLLPHLMVNITPNRSGILSLLHQLLTKIKALFSSLAASWKHDSESQLNSDSESGPSSHFYSDAEQTVFKCYLYPLLICLMNDYRILPDPALRGTSLMYIDRVEDGVQDAENKREMCDAINRILVNVIPNYTFELLKLSNTTYRFECFQYLPESYKAMMRERTLKMADFATDFRAFCRQVLQNMEDSHVKLDKTVDSVGISGVFPVNSGFVAPPVMNGVDSRIPEVGVGSETTPLTCQQLSGKRQMVNDNELVLEILSRSDPVELHGAINYYESVALYNFRKTKSLYFVNLVSGGRSYEGIIIANEPSKKKHKAADQVVEAYYIGTRRLIWNLGYSADIEVLLNLVRTVTDCRKISKLVTSNEFLLLNFILKNAVIFLNLANQHYFVQLVSMFLQRLQYNLDMAICGNESVIRGDNAESASNEGYLVENLCDIVRVLSENLAVHGNETRITVSLDILGLVCEYFGSGVPQLEGLFDERLLGRLFTLFYHLKPCNHRFILRVLNHVKQSHICGFVDPRRTQLVALLFHFNQNKYEVASNIMLPYIARNDSSGFNRLLEEILDYYDRLAAKEGRVEQVNGVHRLTEHRDVRGSCPEAGAGGPDFGVFLTQLSTILEDYLRNIDDRLNRGMTVSGLVNLASNLMQNVRDCFKPFVRDLDIVYLRYMDLIKRLISQYLSPRVEEVESEEGGTFVDCRGYYINRVSGLEEEAPKSNVTIKYGVCELHNEVILAPGGGLVGGRTCGTCKSYEITNRNEFKQFNYLVYKLVQELVGGVQAVLEVMGDGVTESVGTPVLEDSEMMAARLKELISALICSIINCRHVGCNDILNTLLLYAMQRLVVLEQATKPLYGYIYGLIQMIIADPSSAPAGSQPPLETCGFDGRLLSRNVMDINTRSEHLSLIFLTIIKAEGNKKISTLCNQVVFVLVYILKLLDGIKAQKKAEVSVEGAAGIPVVDREDVIELMRGVHIGRPVGGADDRDNGTGSDGLAPERSEESLGRRSRTVINVLNILRYVHRCIDLKYMNAENILDVLRVGLGYLSSTSWSVQNSASLLLSTVLSGFTANHHMFNMALQSDASFLDEFSGIIGSGSTLVAYYALYMLQLILASPNSLVRDGVLRDGRLMGTVERLLGSENLYLRKIAAAVLCEFYLNGPYGVAALEALKRTIIAGPHSSNSLNGYLLLLKGLLSSTDSFPSDLDMSDLSGALTILSKRVSSVENAIVIAEIVSLLDPKSELISGVFESNETVKRYLNRIRLYRNYRFGSLENGAKDLVSQLEEAGREAWPVGQILKCLDKVYDSSELPDQLPSMIYTLILKYKHYLPLWSQYFRFLNKLFWSRVGGLGRPACPEEALSRLRTVDPADTLGVSRLFENEYYILVKYCLKNDLTSNTTLYYEIFESLYCLFLLLGLRAWYPVPDSHTDLSHTRRHLRLMKMFLCLLANNVREDIELAVRLRLSALYRDTFPMIGSIRRDCGSNCPLASLIRDSWVSVIVNILDLMHDDTLSVRTNIRSLVRLHVLDGTVLVGSGAPKESHHSVTIWGELSYERAVLRYMVNSYGTVDALTVFTRIICNQLEVPERPGGERPEEEKIYEEEETNMYRERMLFVKNIFLILTDFLANGASVDEISNFLSGLSAVFKVWLGRNAASSEGCAKALANGQVIHFVRPNKTRIINAVTAFMTLSLKIYVIATLTSFEPSSHTQELLSLRANLDLSYGIVVKYFPGPELVDAYERISRLLSKHEASPVPPDSGDESVFSVLNAALASL